MMLKRVYDRSSGAPVLKQVKVLRAGARQNFAPRFIDKAVMSGLATLGGGHIKLHTIPELVYRILREPGYYCCHCEAKQADSAAAETHIGSVHPGATSPDDSNPAGYRRDNFFACIKEG